MKIFKAVLQYLWNILIWLDQGLNTFAGGHPDECVSARLGREFPNSILRKVVDFVFGKGHCEYVSKYGDGAKSVLK